MTGKEIVTQWESEDYRCNNIALNSQTLIAAIDAALQAEREACAKVVLDRINGWTDPNKRALYEAIADEIRARVTP